MLLQNCPFLPGEEGHTFASTIAQSNAPSQIRWNTETTFFSHTKIFNIMKKLIFANCVLGLALIFSFCSKPDLKQELGTVTPDITSSDRGPCCMQLVVTSGNFQSAEICGVSSSNTSCTFSNTCGNSSGFWQTIQNGEWFCAPSGQPFRITNTGSQPITFYLYSTAGNSGSACVSPRGSISFQYTCGSGLPPQFCP